MSTVISCPNCHGDVSLPPDATPVLICPLCQAEFTLQPVLADPAPAAPVDAPEYAEPVDGEAFDDVQQAPLAEPIEAAVGGRVRRPGSGALRRGHRDRRAAKRRRTRGRH